MFDLSQAVALVTGGAQGIGRTFVEHLLAAGAKVAIGDLTNSVGAKTQQELVAEYPGKILFVPCDVTNPTEFEAAVKSTIQKFGTINLIINNAGICNESEGAWQKMIRINIDGTVTGTKLGFKYMSKENGGTGGTVVNIASLTTFVPWDPVPVYCATKAFVNQFSRSYGRPLHYESSGVKVIAINPGLTDTAILEHAAQGLVKDCDKVRENLSHFLETHPIQQVENMGKGLITVLQNAENGAMWVIQDDEPAREITLQYNCGTTILK
uniref:15-hydroxyprostaglandin dehydrogenase [NAD(+)] n=1 Tax=Lygus hesperus TaxID=30085 RepID=A0A0A9WS12_LYGHE